MRRFRYLLIGVFFFSGISKIYGCVCCASSSTFCGDVSTGGEKLALVTGLRLGVHLPNQEYILVEVIEDLNNNIAGDTIEVLGNDGTACPPVLKLGIGDTILANLHEKNYNGKVVYLTPECENSAIYYNQDSLYGSIFPFVNRMSYIDFIENLMLCESSNRYLNLYGKITSWKDQDIGVPQMNLSIDNGDHLIASDDNGLIRIPFREVTENDSVNFDLSSTYNLKRGLSTADIIRIRRHLLSEEEFTSPWEKIAADVNNSETITTLDIVILQKIILGQLESFINNDSWRFVKREYEFPMPENPWYEEIDAKWEFDLCGNLRVNMIAIKIGDVDCSFVDDL